jgi:hypothetical protein
MFLGYSAAALSARDKSGYGGFVPQSRCFVDLIWGWLGTEPDTC